jgi:hypothetical protein
MSLSIKFPHIIDVTSPENRYRPSIPILDNFSRSAKIAEK